MLLIVTNFSSNFSKQIFFHIIFLFSKRQNYMSMCQWSMFLIIAPPKISCADNIIQKKVRKVSSIRGRHTKIELFVKYERRDTNRLELVARISLHPLYPITGSENVSRYFGSPWGQECRTFSDQPSTTINHNHISTHPQLHTKTKINSPIPDRFTSTVSLTSSSFYIYILYFNPLFVAIYLLSKVLDIWAIEICFFNCAF